MGLHGLGESEKETRVTHGTACGSARARGSDQLSITSAHRASCTFLKRCVEPHNLQAGLRSLPPFGRSTGAWPVSASADRNRAPVEAPWQRPGYSQDTRPSGRTKSGLRTSFLCGHRKVFTRQSCLGAGSGQPLLCAGPPGALLGAGGLAEEVLGGAGIRERHGRAVLAALWGEESGG